MLDLLELYVSVLKLDFLENSTSVELALDILHAHLEYEDSGEQLDLLM